MDVVVEILGRATFNEEFAIITSQTVTLAAEAVTVVPEIPAEAAGQDLRLRLQSPMQIPVKVKCFIGVRMQDATSTYGSHGGQSQLFPFRGDEVSIVAARAGVALQ